MKRKILLLGMLLVSGQSVALEPADVTTYCNNIKAAAQAAQSNYISSMTPAKPPTDVFTDSVDSCIADIANMGIGISIPGIADGLLDKLAKQLMTKACNAVKSQYDAVVQQAENTVNDATSINGTSTVGVNTNNSGTVTTTTNTSASSQIFNSEISNPVNSTVDGALK